jgi:hypothetical protein
VWIAGVVVLAPVGVLEVLGGLPPAATPPVATASAGDAGMTRNDRLQKNKLRVRTRKTTTSFVGLRG